MIDPDLRAIITPELTGGEELLWAGQPQEHFQLISWIYMFVFSLIWLIFCFGSFLALIYSTLFHGQETKWILMPMLLLLLFSIFGAAMTYHAVRNLFGQKKLVYGLTNKRGLILDNFMKPRKVSIGKDALSIMRRQDRGALGTLTFAAANPLAAFMQMNTLQLQPVFSNINNPDHVEALILKHFHLKDGRDS